MLWLATLVFAGLTLALALLETHWRHAANVELFRLWGDRFALPLLRVFCLMAFIGCAYPALFGLRDAPSLWSLLEAGHGRFDRSINLLFFAGLLLPALPLLRRVPGLVLPLQGCLGVALLFGWLASARGLAELRRWPDAGTLLMLAAVSGLAMACASLLSRGVQDPLGRQDIYDLLLIWLQLPVLILYGHWLGRQLIA